MSDNKKPTNEKWKGMSLEEFFAKLPKKTFRMKIDGLYQKIKRKCQSSKTTIRGYRGHAMPHRSTPTTFKDSYRVETTPSQGRSYEQWLVDEMAHRAYHDMVDGKGDHDCGHEH